MAVFRVQKTQNYTIMSNHHLRNKALSLKAKGLLSLMLSLPEDWDYTTRGLASICKEGVDGIRATVRELENAGYIIRRRVRDQSGQVRSMEYTVFEQPQKPEPENPVQAKPEREKPVQAKPAQENPAQENPAQENPTQLNTKETNNENSKYESDLIRTQYRNLILDNIEYALLAARNPTDRARLDELVHLMPPMLWTPKSYVCCFIRTVSRSRLLTATCSALKCSTISTSAGWTATITFIWNTFHAGGSGII